jgi:hypothetical protein
MQPDSAEIAKLFSELENNSRFKTAFQKLAEAGVDETILRVTLRTIAALLRDPSCPTAWTEPPVASWRSLRRTFVKQLRNNADWIERLQRDCPPMNLQRYIRTVDHANYSPDVACELEAMGSELPALPYLLRTFADVVERQISMIMKLRGGSMRSSKYQLNAAVMNLLEWLENDCQEEAYKKLRMSEQWNSATAEQQEDLWRRCSPRPFWDDVAALLNCLLPKDHLGTSFSSESLKVFRRQQPSSR